MRIDATVVACHLDQRAPGLTETLFGGLDEHTADSAPVQILPHHQHRYPPDRRVAVDGDHDMDADEAKDLAVLLGDQRKLSEGGEPIEVLQRLRFRDRMAQELKQRDDVGGVFRFGFADNYSLSSACRMRPTSPPTNVPLMRMYCRSRPTAPSSLSVTVRASQPRTVSLTSFTIEVP